MSRYQFASASGAAGEGVLESIRQQREDDRRAALLEIQRQDSEQRRKVEQESILTSQQNREGSLLEDAQKGWDPGQDISGVDPAILAAAKRRGLVNPNARKPVASVSTSEAVQDPEFSGPTQDADPTYTPPTPAPAPLPESATKGEFFIGNPKDRARERRMKNVGGIMGVLQDPNTSQMDKIVALTNAMEEDNLPSQAYTSMQPEKPYLILDDADGSVKEAGKDSKGRPYTAPPGDNNILRRPRAPQPQRASYTFAGTSEDGRPVTLVDGMPYTVDEAGKRVPFTGKLGAKPANPNAGKGRQGIPPAILNALTTAQKGAGKPGGQQAVQQAQEAVLSRYDTHPDVRETVRAVLHATDDTRSNAEIVQDHADAFTGPDGQVDENQLNQFADLLALVRGM